MNKHIIVAGTIILIAGCVNNASSKGGSLTRIIIGSYIFVLMLSIADMFGGPMSKISGGIALIAAVYVVLNVFPWDATLALVKGNGKPDDKNTPAKPTL